MDTTLAQYENILLRLAWSFSRSTGKELEELIGEASLAYCKALKSFQPDKKSCLSTWIYTCVKNHLISWTKKQPFSLGGGIDFEIPTNETQNRLEFLSGLSIMSKDAQNICQMIFDSPTKPQKVEITKTLRENKWSWKRIWAGMKEIKVHLQEA